jgi:ACT domain-containing protein
LTNDLGYATIKVSFTTQFDLLRKEDGIMDKALLEYEMKKKGVTIDEMCKVIGISRSAFYRKCNGTSEFTQSEIQTIVDYLNLESPMGIFFAH